MLFLFFANTDLKMVFLKRKAMRDVIMAFFMPTLSCLHLFCISLR